jgi:hypothetical protein
MKQQHRMFRILSSLLVLLLVVTSSGSSGVAPRLPPTYAAETTSFQQLAAATESEPNDELHPSVAADFIGPTLAEREQLAGKLDWSRVVTGTISSADDRDVYQFTVPPASTIHVTMDNPPADYDLVLATAGNLELIGDNDGLEGVLELGGSIAALGGSIAALGGSIAALGGSIAALGGSIAALGGSIAALGGSIAALSVQPGTAGEEIQTFVWQPGTYFLAVTGSNGASSDQPYTLNFEISEGALEKPARAPRVRLELSDVADASNIRTLYIVSKARMNSYYGSMSGDDVEFAVSSIINTQNTKDPRNQAYMLQLDNYAGINDGPELATLYADWDNNAGNPFYANRLAQTIDNIINAATVRNPLEANATGMLATTGSFTPTVATDPPLPHVEHIVLVGADPIIPFLRVPDQTAIANEGDYAEYMRQEFGLDVIDPSTPLGAALKYRTLLTDNIYGADRSYRFGSFPLFIPNRAVGRLVETPTDIVAYLQTYSDSLMFPSPLKIDAADEDDAFIAGYDFVTDQADAVAGKLEDFMDLDPDSSTRLINDTWTAANLRNAWFADQFTDFYQPLYSVETRNSFPLQSLNGHFDHWQIIPADGGDAGTLLAQSVYTPTAMSAEQMDAYFTNRLAYSIGCHSGYNVTDPLEPLRDIPEFASTDFPQAYLKQGGNWIGNTGYGYGSLDSIDYSERLSLLFTEELGRDVRDSDDNYIGQSIGQALVHAKQRYVRNATSLSVYDAKVLQVMNLYGLPQLHVLVDDPQPPPPEERFTSSDRIAPLPPASGSLTRLITFTIDYNNTSIERTGSRRLTINTVDVEDTFIGAAIEDQFVRTFRAHQLGEPELPQFAYDLNAVSAQDNATSLDVRSVKLLSGTYDEIVDFDPQFTQVITETFEPLSSGTVEPSFEGGEGRWYPAKFFNYTSTIEGDVTREQLVVKTAQFNADTGGRTGQLRPYSRLVFEVRYIDPKAGNVDDSLFDDKEPPYIESVDFTKVDGTSLQNSSIQVDVTVSDSAFNGYTSASGVASVEAAYTIPGATGPQWQRVDLSPPTGSSGTWTALIPFGDGNVDLIVSATDQAGNTSFFTAKGSLDPAEIQDPTPDPNDENVIWLPLINRPE